MRKLTFLLGLSVLACASAPAQEFRALISGRTVDPSGAAIAGADISAVNVDTNIRSATRSGLDGNFALPQLRAGTYALTAEATGFRKYTRQGLVVAVGDKANIEIRMEVGGLEQSITVTAELTGVESNQSVMGQLMDNKKISELPLNGRQAFMLVQLSAGVVFTQQAFGADAFTGTRAWDTNGALTIHGSRASTNAFLLDGAPLGMNGQWDYAPLIDSVEEFKVSTPANDASQGLTGGGVINMTMKSGTNRRHYLLSHFIRNHIFDAVPTQQNRAAAARPDLAAKQHQWNNVSFVVDGPIVRNKFFYSGSYEGFWERVPFPTTQTVPTVPQRSGDFSQTFNSAGQLMVVHDPLSTRQSGSSFVRDPFPGNRLPQERIVAVSRNLLKFVPPPNIVTNPLTNTNNFGAAPNVGKYAYNSWYMKFDYVWNDFHRTFFSETQNYGSEYNSYNGLPFGNPARTGDDLLRRDHYAATLDHVYTVTPRTVLNARLAWDRYISYSRRSSIDDFDGSALGFKGRTGSFPVPRIPALSFSDYLSLVNSGNSFPPNEVYSMVADVSRIQGRHFLKFGTRIGQNRFSRNSTGAWYGTFSFNRGFTQRDPQRSDATSGSDLANFLLGFPASGGTDVNPQSTYENKFIGLYIQDDIKLTSKLTVNLGFRWDLQTPATERFNRIIYTFDPTVTYPLGKAQAKGGFVFADPQHRRPWDAKWKDFQPRFGVAYQLTKKMVWRSGYGLSFLPLNGSGGNGGVQQNGYSRNTPFVATIGGGLNSYIPGLPGTGTFEIPFPEGILPPFGPGLGPRTQVGQSVSFQNRDYVIPRVHQFYVGFEYDLPLKILAEVSYVASRTRRFPVGRALNAISLEERLKGFADPNYLNAAVPNPFAGAPELVGTGLSAATITRTQSLRAYPQFTGVTRNGNSIGMTSYNGLEMRINKRLSGGVTVIGAYTFSKTLEATGYLEDQYTTLEHVLASFDRTHHLTVSSLVMFPFGRGKRFGSGWSKTLDAVLGNWQYNLIVEHMNGTPTSMPGARPARDPRMPEGQQRFDRWFNTCTLLTNGSRSKCASPDEPIVWVQLRPNELRDYSTRFPNLRNHWRPQINSSLFKFFPIRERCTLEFRAEVFNAFNSPIYKGPNTSLTSSNFGVVLLDQQNFPRNMQFAWRLRF